MITTLLINSVAIFLCAYLLNGVEVKNYFTALGVAVVLAIVNVLIKPVIVLLTLPLTVITLGLFVLVINAWMLMLTGKIVDGFKVKGFGAAFLFGILISLLNAILFRLF